MPTEINKTVEEIKNDESETFKVFASPDLPNFLLELPFDSENTELRSAAFHILEIGVGYCYDGGCAGEPITLFLEGEDPITENGVQIFNRSAFLTYIQNAENAREHLAFEILDIKDFRSADMVKSPNGENGAEIVLRRFSRTLADNAKAMNRALVSLGMAGAKIVVARYGGDEFGVLYENIPDKIPDNLPEEWQKRCKGYTSFREVVRNFVTGETINQDGERETQVDGVFLRNGRVSHENVRLKKEGSGAFGIPQDEEKAGIFWERLQKGLLLRESEINANIKREEASVETGQMETISTIAGDVRTLVEIKNNIANIVGNNPKLMRMSQHVLTISESFSGQPNAEQKRMILYQQFEEFLRNTVCDRLLSSNVESMRAFAEIEMSQPFERIHVIDGSGLKEINDNYGLQSGDDMIVALWDKVLGSIQNPDEPGVPEGVRIFRRGSTILICETKDSTLNEHQINSLSGISTLKIKSRENTIEVPVGYSSITPARGYKPETTAELRELIDTLFIPEKKQLEQRLIFEQIKRLGESIFSDETNLLEMTPSNEQIKNGEVEISPDNFYLIYLFGGKRFGERTSFALTTINEVIDGVLSGTANTDISLEKLLAMRKKIEQAKGEKHGGIRAQQ